MPHYIVTHNPDAKAVFSDKIPQENVQLPGPFGSMEILSTTHNGPINVSTESDIDQYAHDRSAGLGNSICPENGTATAILNMAPGCESPLHRTMTLDVAIVIQGVLELHLDSGEKVTLSAGDSVVQRAGMHKWVNITPNDQEGGWAKMIGFAQCIAQPLEIGGKQLETEFVMS